MSTTETEQFPYLVLVTAKRNVDIQTQAVVNATDENHVSEQIALLMQDVPGYQSHNIISIVRFDTSPQCKKISDLFDSLSKMGIDAGQILGDACSSVEMETASKKELN